MNGEARLGDRVLPKSEKLPESENPYLEADLVRPFCALSLAPTPSMLLALSGRSVSSEGGWTHPPHSQRWWPLDTALSTNGTTVFLTSPLPRSWLVPGELCPLPPHRQLLQ